MSNLIQNLLRWKNLFENFKQCIVEKISKVISLKKFATIIIIRFNKSKIYCVEEICSKISNNASLKKFARKFQNTYRWKNFKIRRWKNLHENFKYHDICFKQKTQTNVVKKCWKIQFSQKNNQEFRWYNLKKKI